jgi:hypothetical protein
VLWCKVVGVMLSRVIRNYREMKDMNIGISGDAIISSDMANTLVTHVRRSNKRPPQSPSPPRVR